MNQSKKGKETPTKDIYLNIIKGNEQHFFTTTPFEFREKILDKFGMEFSKSFNLYNLYFLPLKLNPYFISQINKTIINKYQKINRFYNFEEYVSKSLLYMNYKYMKKTET